MLAMLLLSQVTIMIIFQFTTRHAPPSFPNHTEYQSHSLCLVSDNKINISPLLFIFFYFALLVKQLVAVSDNNCCWISPSTIPRTASYHCCLSSSHSFSAAIFPELRPPIFPNEFTLDSPLMLLLPPSFMFRVFLDLLGLEQVMSAPS